MSGATAVTAALAAAVLTACSSAVAVVAAPPRPSVHTPTPTPTPVGSDVPNPHPVALPRSTVPPAPLPPLRIMVVGDSLAVGLYATAVNTTFAATLARDLGGVIVQNDARAGYTVAMELGLVQRAADTVADVLVVEAGTNDAKNRVPPAATAAGYPALLAAAQQTAGGRARLVCLGVWMPRASAAQYDAALQPLCQRAGGTFVPLRELYEAPGNRGPYGVQVFTGVRDGYHPNDNGHRAIAGAIEAALK